MKKIIIIIGLLLALTGCTNIKDLSYEQIAQNFGVESPRVNEFRTGYKYYLPRGMQVQDSTIFNEVLDDGRYNYYLYVDAVSYINKVKYEYEKNNTSEFSASITNDDKFGYIEVNLRENDKYLVEIMYNYAKIEVIVYERDINKCVAYAISILTSIAYNDNVIENYLGDDIFLSSEEAYDIFEIVGSDNYLQFTDEVTETEEVNDPDYIN